MHEKYNFIKGKEIGKWLIISDKPFKKTSNGKPEYIVAKCGYCLQPTTLWMYRLTAHKLKKCSKCSQNEKYEHFDTGFAPGSKHGLWTVSDKEVLTTKYNGRWIHVICNCGFEQYAAKHHIKKSGGCKKCIPAKNFKGIGSLSGCYFSSIKKCAKNRKIPFSVTKEYVWKLFQKQNRKCALSSIMLSMERKHRQNPTYSQTASLDRIDSTKAYLPENVQWVHKDINKMKGSLPEDVFKKYCKLVTNNC